MRRKWTEEEAQYLSENYGRVSVKRIAKKLGRTEDSVNTKAYKLKLGNMKDNVDGIPMTELPIIVGRPYTTVRGTWVRAGLKVNKYGKGIAYVQEKELIKFMESHKNLYDPRKCDYYYFYTHKWFLDYLEEMRNGTSNVKHYHRWTFEEKSKLLYLRDVKCLYFSEIAEIFGMNEKTIYKEYKLLTKDRPKRKYNAS